ncbi:MAG: YbaB/EbfC family nucleoid-associated protein [Aureispira sp.]
MFGGMEEMQKQMQEKLTSIIVEEQAGGGLIKIKANAARQILDVSIAPELDLTDKEELEDLILEGFNRVIAAAAAKEQEESQAMLSKMLPGGMGNLGNMFG